MPETHAPELLPCRTPQRLAHQSFVCASREHRAVGGDATVRVELGIRTLVVALQGSIFEHLACARQVSKRYFQTRSPVLRPDEYTVATTRERRKRKRKRGGWVSGVDEMLERTTTASDGSRMHGLGSWAYRVGKKYRRTWEDQDGFHRRSWDAMSLVDSLLALSPLSL